MKFIQFTLGLILFMLPRKIIEKFFIPGKSVNNKFYFSGRVAIYRIAKSLSNMGVKTAIVPEYICNVVHRALVEAGFTLVEYECDDDFEPNIEKIIGLGMRYPDSVLCIAPLFGADGGETWIASDVGRRWRQENRIFLMFDICQDFSRFIMSSLVDEKFFAIISSFNNKSFPGLMGAAVVSDIKDHDYKKATAREIIDLFKLLIINLRKMILPFRKKKKIINNQAEKFDYSYCMHFPYDFHHSAAAKIQLAIGFAGRLMLPIYMENKKNYIENKWLSPRLRPHYFTSAIVELDKSYTRLVLKSPYAIYKSPSNSLKPNLKTVFFRGYDDIK